MSTDPIALKLERLYVQQCLRTNRAEIALRKIQELVGDRPEVRDVLAEAREQPDFDVRSEFDEQVSKAVLAGVMAAGLLAPPSDQGRVTIVASPLLPRDRILMSDGKVCRTFKLVELEEPEPCP